MKTKTKSKRYLKLPALMVIVATILVLFGSNLLTTSSPSDLSQLDTGWSVCRGDNVYENVTLSEFQLIDTQKGEEITITKTLLPVAITSPSIMFKSSLTAVEVLVDGKKAYEYGKDLFEKGIFIPKKYHIINIDDGAKSHEVCIKFIVSDKRSMNKFFPIYYGTKHELVQSFLQYHRLALFIGGFFHIYSCILFCLGIFLLFYRRIEIPIFFSSAISALMEVYIFAYNDIFCFISDEDNFFSVMEYMSLYFIPLAISVLLYATHPEIANLRQRILVVLNAVVPVIVWLLHLSNIIHLEAFIIPLQAFACLEIVIILPALIVGVRKQHRKKVESETYAGVDADQYLLLGFINLIVFGLLEMGKFNFTKMNEHIAKANTFENVNFFNLGLLFFIVCIFIYYFLVGIDHLNADNVKKELEGLAFTDNLTGLMNRGKCMQYAATLTGPYAVVSLDLDRLKYVNDTFGHLEGDRMIKTFSMYLEKDFEGASLIGRTGGDEFIVFFTEPGADVCDRCIRSLEDDMRKFNKGKDKITLSASAGYAYSYEAESGEFEDVFYLADSRMYQVKEKHHA